MLIREFVETDHTAKQLTALSEFLASRAEDEVSKKQISQDAFIELAQSMGISISPTTLSELINQEPLKNVLEPLEPNSGVVRFKGNTKATTDMTVDKARDIVDTNAKQAMRRHMKTS